MTKRMLIDAAHPEETRVVLLDGNQIEDFDVEVSSRRQLKGNIYLAKVIRVEPSLQAAFVDYGGNRHGFLAFSEIHPDYYQIPVSDRPEPAEVAENGDSVSEDAADGENGDGGENGENGEAAEAVETVGGDEVDDIEDTHKRRRAPSARQYKIQEVIKRRQVLLIQVVKEERGNKGAALTTYLSLAGRYCVLMPNTARGGGISRKITNAADRKSLKTILGSLDVPEGMAVILRTAGIGRSKAEIKRDFEYLSRLWTNVRDTTLESTAPTLVHEEGDIVRRSIRDLYSRDIEEVQVEGDDAYKAAKEFMKLLIPSHARRVKQHKETDAPLLRHFGVESQLDAIHNPIVHLPSGGYLVINPTEALVSVDVNSGKSTKERNIEETALKTNLEAAEELARQLRLRDLAGLIVIDFIDMDVNRNNAQVERRMKEGLKHDRARIQVGRISPFGLLEMSRQRLRPSLIETSSEPCPYCAGTGIRRSTESTALVVLRAIDEEGANHRASELTVHVPTAVALYILNHKRDALAELETKHGFRVLLSNDDSLIPPDLRLERTKNPAGETISEMVATQRADAAEESPRKRRRRRGGRNRDENEETTVDAAEKPAASGGGGDRETTEDGEEKTKRRRRSRRGGRRRRKGGEAAAGEGVEANQNVEATPEGSEQPNAATAEDGNASEAPKAEAAEGGEGEERPKRRRPRRRGRRSAANDAQAPQDAGSETTAEGQDPVEAAAPKAAEADAGGDDAPAEDKPKRTRTRRRKPAEPDAKAEGAEAEAGAEAAEKPKRTRSRRKKVDEPAAPAEAGAASEEKPVEKPAEKPKRTRAKKADVVADAPPKAEPKTEPKAEAPADKQPKRKGWWNIGG